MTTLIKRRDDMPRRPLDRCHGGVGALDWTVVLNKSDGPGCRMNFMHDDVLPPGVSIGVHRHEHDDEYYYVISGSGVMTLDGRQFDVGPGDITGVFPGGEHGLENTGSEDMRILVISVEAGWNAVSGVPTEQGRAKP